MPHKTEIKSITFILSLSGMSEHFSKNGKKNTTHDILIDVVFDSEHEYDTLRCHISSMSHAIPEKGLRLQNFRNRSKSVY